MTAWLVSCVTTEQHRVSGPPSESWATSTPIRRTPDLIFCSSRVLHIISPQLQLAFALIKIYIGYTEVLYLNKVKSAAIKRFGGIKLPTPGPETHSTLFSIKLFLI